MPYYRITAVLKDRPFFQGIKFYDNHSIDAVTNIVRIKAGQYYGEHNVIDIEAAMLSNHCAAVKHYREQLEKTTGGYRPS